MVHFLLLVKHHISSLQFLSFVLFCFFFVFVFFFAIFNYFFLQVLQEKLNSSSDRLRRCRVSSVSVSFKKVYMIVKCTNKIVNNLKFSFILFMQSFTLFVWIIINNARGSCFIFFSHHLFYDEVIGVKGKAQEVRKSN